MVTSTLPGWSRSLTKADPVPKITVSLPTGEEPWPGDVHAVFDEMTTRPFDDPGGNGETLGEIL